MCALPRKAIPEMTYCVLGETLYLYLLTHSCSMAELCQSLERLDD